MTENTEAASATPAKTARKRKPKAAKKLSKREQARRIYASNSRGKNGPNRQKILEKFIKDVGLTPKGASTYYQTIKGEAA